MADSPRWCELCGKYGDHHTETHEQWDREDEEDARLNSEDEMPPDALACPQGKDIMNAYMEGVPGDDE